MSARPLAGELAMKEAMTSPRLSTAAPEKAGTHVIPRERDEAMSDYAQAVDRLAKALYMLEDHRRVAWTEQELLRFVDDGRQALQIIAATAQVIGGEE